MRKPEKSYLSYRPVTLLLIEYPGSEPEFDISVRGCSLSHLPFHGYSVFLPDGSTEFYRAAPDQPVYRDISPYYVHVQFPVLTLPTTQPVLIRHSGHQVDKHVIDGGYHGAGDWVSLRRVFI